MKKRNDDDKAIKLNEKQKADLANHIELTWDSANEARNTRMNDLREGLALYWGIRRPKNFPFANCANLHVPLIRTMSDTLHSNLIGSIDMNKPVAVSPVGPEDARKAKKTEKFLNWQFTTQIDFKAFADRAAQTALQYGAAPVKVRYCLEEEGDRTLFDGIRLDILPPERFLTPPDAPSDDIDEMDYCIQEIPMSRSDIKKRIKAGRFDKMTDEELAKVGNSHSRASRDGDDLLENVRSIYSGVDSVGFEVTQKNYGTVLEWHGYYDIKGNGIEEPIRVYFLKDLKKVLRVNPWKRLRPFVLVKITDILNRAWGESVADILKSLNQELNTLHNQRVDAVTISNIPFFFYDPVAGFDPNKVQLVPGMGIPVQGSPSQAVYFPVMNTVKPEMYQEEEMIFRYAERILGAGANVQGIMETKRVTAREISSIDRRAGIRFLTLLHRLKSGFSKVVKIALELNHEFMPAEVQMRIAGVDTEGPLFESFKRDDLVKQYDITVNGNSIIDDQADRQDMMSAYQVGMLNPLIMRDENAIYELTKDLYEKMGVKRVGAYLRKPEDTIPKNPVEEHNLFFQEEYVPPNIAENVDDHLRQHAEIINTPETFERFTPKAKALLLRHFSETRRMKETLEQLKIIAQLEQVNGMQMQLQMQAAGMGEGPQAGGAKPGGAQAKKPAPRPSPAQPPAATPMEAPSA